MKFPGEAAERVARSLIVEGPATSAMLADRLGMTPAGVRKHIRALVEAGLIEAQDRPPFGPTPERGRGRPSLVFAISRTGRLAADETGADFALEAMRFLARDPQLIEAFAQERAEHLATHLRSAIAHEPADAVARVADALTTDGYAATVEPVGEHAVQLCQHHCPIVDIAAEFPQFCEAETAAVGEVLGRHVTRLATIAHGDGVCTTLIPVQPTTRTERKVSA
jgi:predicted ArsR family transcriptional regulator